MFLAIGGDLFVGYCHAARGGNIEDQLPRRRARPFHAAVRAGCASEFRLRSGGGVGKAGELAAVTPVPPEPSVPQTAHFPSVPMRPMQEPSGQSRRRWGLKVVLLSCFVDMVRERLI